MNSYIVLATKGRAAELRTLLDQLAQQTFPAKLAVVVGTSTSDIQGLDRHPLTVAGGARVMVSDRAGLTTQRNVGIEAVLEMHPEAAFDNSFMVFFDDDFRPAGDWLERCAESFKDSSIVGVTGQVLADGARGAAIGEDDAMRYIRGERTRQAHWSSGLESRDVRSLYGCNMAFRGTAITRFRFDEALPLYGWQEDLDLSAQVRQLGRTIYAPGPRGVHLGVKGGRISGLRFGYSQIANPIYLWRKGTMSPAVMTRFLVRALGANVLRTLSRDARADYVGRLRGNIRAVSDLIRGDCHPTRIETLSG